MPVDVCLKNLDGYRQVADWFVEFQKNNAGVGPQSVRVAVCADTLPSVLELDELLYELRAFDVVVQACPFGYLFSFIKRFCDAPECVLPDRADITASTPCIDAYFRYLRSVCSRRGVLLLGDAPRLRRLFDDDRAVEAADLLQVPVGRITEAGIRENIRSALRYLVGDEAVGLIDAELARAQLWQWVHHETGVLDTGRIISQQIFTDWLEEEETQLLRSPELIDSDPDRLRQAASLLVELTSAERIAPALPSQSVDANL